ncbi:MAG: hypothetical protein CMJ59_24400 [Planctomycetaceae bacterium]|nr:hypothetical protein [Planctomycetaceae bacterium]
MSRGSRQAVNTNPWQDLVMKVLYIPQPGIMHPWYDDFAAAVADEHEIIMFDFEQPAPQQLQGVGVVVELGGKMSTPDLLDAALEAGVQLWQIMGTGLDHVDVQCFLDKGLPLANTPGQFSSVALAEHALFFMLWFAKKYPENHVNLRAGLFYDPVTDDLESATLGLVGFGNSAKQLALRTGPLGMRILAVDTVDVPNDVRKAHFVESCGGPGHLEQLLSESDYVSLHTPLTATTRNLIGRRELELMKSSSVLINVARGEIVDEQALIEALQTGQIAGAGLDAFEVEPLPLEHPFFEMPNVLMTPHTAGGSRGTSRRRGRAGADNVNRIASGLDPLYRITSVE